MQNSAALNAETGNGELKTAPKHAKPKDAAVSHHLKSGVIRNYAKTIYRAASVAAKMFGVEKRTCNGCGYRGRFVGFGFPPRYDAQCPACGSLERHRLLKFWFDENENLLSKMRVLHFAPEEKVKSYLIGRVHEYQGADITPGVADLVLNIESIDLADRAVDLIVCSHVLEHVDDAKALAEIYRVLTPGGFVLLLFPIVEGWAKTLEESDLPNAINGAAQRRLYFGQHNHVRFYGRDVRERIRAAGFEPNEYVATEPRVSEYGLLRGETIFVGRKPD